MLQVIGELLPIAVAVAISSVPIMATILILLSPRRPRAAVSFLLGWVFGIALVAAACVALAQTVPASRSPRRPDTVVGILDIIVGVALIGIAVVSWRRSRRGDSGEMPHWLASVGGLGRWAAFGLALILNLRPKGLLLAIAAGLAVRAGDLTMGQSWMAIAIYTAVAASTVAVPVIATVMNPERTEPGLRSAEHWLTRNSGALTGMILGLISVVVIGTGLGRL